MGRATVVVANELLGRIRDPEGEIIKRVSLVGPPVRFCEDTAIATVETPLLPDGYHGRMDIIVEDGTGVIRFRKDCDV